MQVAIVTSNEVLLIVVGWSNLGEKQHLEWTCYDPVRNLASVWRDTCSSQHWITSLVSKQTKQLVILLGTSLHFSPIILIMPDLTNLATTLFQALMVPFSLGRLGRNLHRGSLRFSTWFGGWPYLAPGNLIFNNSIWFLIPNIDTFTCRAFDLALNGAPLSVVCYGRLQQLPLVTQEWPPWTSDSGVWATACGPSEICILNPEGLAHIAYKPEFHSGGWLIKLMVTTIANTLFLDLGPYCLICFLWLPKHLKHFQPIKCYSRVHMSLWSWIAVCLCRVLAVAVDLWIMRVWWTHRKGTSYVCTNQRSQTMEITFMVCLRYYHSERSSSYQLFIWVLHGLAGQYLSLEGGDCNPTPNTQLLTMKVGK